MGTTCSRRSQAKSQMYVGRLLKLLGYVAAQSESFMYQAVCSFMLQIQTFQNHFLRPNPSGFSANHICGHFHIEVRFENQTWTLGWQGSVNLHHKDDYSSTKSRKFCLWSRFSDIRRKLHFFSRCAIRTNSMETALLRVVKTSKHITETPPPAVEDIKRKLCPPSILKDPTQRLFVLLSPSGHQMIPFNSTAVSGNCVQGPVQAHLHGFSALFECRRCRHVEPEAVPVLYWLRYAGFQLRKKLLQLVTGVKRELPPAEKNDLSSVFHLLNQAIDQGAAPDCHCQDKWCLYGSGCKNTDVKIQSTSGGIVENQHTQIPLYHFLIIL